MTASDCGMAVCVGVLSGVLGGALNEGGPPVIMYLALKRWPHDVVKATLQVYFAVVSFGVLAMMWHRGIYQKQHLIYDALGLPAAALGAFAGTMVYRRIDQDLFGWLVIIALGLVGTAYVSHAAMQLLDDVNSSSGGKPLSQLSKHVHSLFTEIVSSYANAHDEDGGGGL